jgi:outer membrane protein assembly factor BamB
MTRIAIIQLALACVFLSSAQAQPPVKEIGGFQHPESVYQSGKFLYVADIGAELAPVKKDGDGYIGKIDLSTGKLMDAHFLPVVGVLHSPKGMAMEGDTLLVADIDRIVGFDVVTRKQVVELTIGGTGFLNDLVVGDGKLYASATDNGKIYEIDVKTGAYHALAIDSIRGANGLFYKKGKLYCVSIGNFAHPDGSVFEIGLGRPVMKRIADYQGLLDGISIVGNTIYFSDWREQTHGVVLALDLVSKKLRTLPFPEIAGPADFSVSRDRRYFIIPEMMTGKVLFKPL